MSANFTHLNAKLPLKPPFSRTKDPAHLYRTFRSLPGADLEVPDVLLHLPLVLLHLPGVLKGAGEQGQEGGQGQGPGQREIAYLSKNQTGL